MLNRKNLNVALSFVVVALVASFASAQEGHEAAAATAEAATGLGDKVKMLIALAAGLGMAIASLGGAMGQGRAVAAALEGIARNPGAKSAVQTPMIIGLALIESLVLLTFVISIMLVGKI
ncbi:MAG: ATP synthase F0 subunit C [Bdellovibrionota bacterium]